MNEFTITEVPLSDELMTKIDAGFRQHALETIGEDGDFKRISFIAYKDEKFAGAVTVSVLLGSLQIRQLFVERQYRRMGLGRTLMMKALEYGEKEKCNVAFVETLSFQALPFYKKFGFSLEFSRKGFSKDTVLHFLRKDLVEQKNTSPCREENEAECCPAFI